MKLVLIMKNYCSTRKLLGFTTTVRGIVKIEKNPDLIMDGCPVRIKRELCRAKPWIKVPND